MAISMTGFGQATRCFAGYTVQIDVKSVNHRYCEIVVRMPREWLKYEDLLRQTVQRKVKRGRVDVFVTIDRDTTASRSVELNWPLAQAYQAAAEQLKQHFGLSDSLSIRDFLQIPELISFQQGEAAAEEELLQELTACVEEATDQLVRMRAAEGNHLALDTEQRMQVMNGLVEQARQLAPQVVADYASKLRARIQDLLQQPVVDEARLATEVALLADRANVDEEMTRLQSHFQQCKQLLSSSEPIGRKLDFLVQEMNREVNTIGSKANHVGLTTLVVDMKAELEKMREQIQNME
ncbi:YicC/YloC family endoribonuclease [Paenibacillus rigui]|uniref:YicC family protein n=1 Tax=Paenibacillus rigui TaxID=554312 RepID=A0A229URC3_9BACL|nr:YicC/YloC family endoribonuclease [Paenibacillus rigui]OXM85863.1 YicC family protein [Paenibacillus rigui]